MDRLNTFKISDAENFEIIEKIEVLARGMPDKFETQLKLCNAKYQKRLGQCGTEALAILKTIDINKYHKSNHYQS